MKYWIATLLVLFLATSAMADDPNFNSAECIVDGSPGSYTPNAANADYVLCDDFDDGTWAVTCNSPAQPCCTGDATCNADPQNNTGSNYAPNDGWEMETNGPSSWPDDDDADPNKRDRALCGSAGFGGTDCTAMSTLIGNEASAPRCYDGSSDGGCNGIGEMGHNNIYGPSLNSAYIRWYFRAEAGADPSYYYGYTKMMTAQTAGGYNMLIAKWEPVSATGIGDANDGVLKVSNKYFVSASEHCGIYGQCNLQQNQGNDLLLRDGNWHYIEMFFDLGTGGLDGTVKMWADDCGALGDQCTGTPTLRLNHTGLKLDGGNLDFARLWIENWSNWGASGVHNIDQVIVSSSGPIGFMSASTWNVVASLPVDNCVTTEADCENVDVTLTGTGSETGVVLWEVDCGDDGTYELSSGPTDEESHAFSNACNMGTIYSDVPGTYQIQVRSTRPSGGAEVIAIDAIDFTINAAAVKSVSVTIDPTAAPATAGTTITATANNYGADPIAWVFECDGDADWNDTCTPSGATSGVCDCDADTLAADNSPYTVGARETNFHPDANATDTTTFTVTAGATWEIVTVTEGPGACDEISPDCQIDITMYGSGTTDGLGVVYELDCDASDGIDYADGNSGSVTGPNYTFTDGCDYRLSPPGTYIISGRSTDDGVVAEYPNPLTARNQMVVETVIMRSLTGASISGGSIQ